MSQLNKGQVLEKKAHQFLWELGYLVFPNLNLYATRTRGSGTIDFLFVTDLDCIGFNFGNFLEKKCFLIDCKHRNEKIFSQLLRTKGLISLLDIDELLILRSSVPATVQEFAKVHNIRLMNNSAFESNIIERNIGVFNINTTLKVSEYITQLDSDGKNILQLLDSQFLKQDNFDNLKETLGVTEARLAYEQEFIDKFPEFSVFEMA